MAKLGEKSMEQKVNIDKLLEVEDPNDVCSKNNIVINNTTHYLGGIDTGDVSTEYDPGF